MKRLLSALILLALCLPMALAEGEPPAEVAAGAEPPVAAPEIVPAPEPVPVPEPAPAPEAPPVAAPDEGANAPGEDANVPGEDVDVPGEDEDAPGEDVDAPSEDVDAPGEDVEAPGEGTLTPPANGAATLEGPGLGGPALMPVPQVADAPQAYVDPAEPGELAALLQTPGPKTVYLLVPQVKIEAFALALLQDVVLLPDPEVFAGGDYVVTLASDGEEITPEQIAQAQEETVDLTVTVEEKKEEGGETPPPGPQEPGEKPEISVQMLDAESLPIEYVPGVWMPRVGFRLSGLPAEGGYSYGALVYGDRLVPLREEEFWPADEGSCTVRFVILNELGDWVAASQEYELMLDFTPPELAVEVSEAKDYTMTISGSDALSGVVAYSLDGGESWSPAELYEGLSIEFTEARRREFAPGMILLRDAAGNVSGNADAVVLDAIPEALPMDYGLDFGGSGEPKPTAAPHASGSGDDSPYGAYELSLPEGAVDALTLGGEAIDLGLEIGEEDDAQKGKFFAELTTWAVDNPSVEEMPGNKAKDTLVIRAEAAAPQVYTWRINGAVLRKLYNTDIAYLLLTAGDAALALPTVGFTAGTRYAELKMEGTSTAEFEYEIVMRVDPEAGGAEDAAAWNLSADCAVTFCVEVADERFPMVDRETTPEMYPFDVYCGPEDLPDYPYGAYPAAGMED